MIACQLLKAQSPAYRQFTDEDGLPSMTVYGIKQDKDGFLWIATTKGICRFDGKEFKKYFIPDMKGQDFPYIFMDETGTPWFYNLAGEVFYVQDDTVRRANVARPGDGYIIYSLLKSDNFLNISWIKNSSMISVRYNIEKDFFPRQLSKSYIFFGILNCELIGLNSSNGIELNNIDINKNISKHSYDISETHNYNVGINEFRQISKDSFVIITAFYAAIYSSNGLPLKQIRLKKLLKNPIIYLSFIDDYNLFLKTVDSSFTYNYITGEINCNTHGAQILNSIFIDKYRRKWISTSNNGLLLLTSDAVIYNSSNSGLKSNEVIYLHNDIHILFFGHENGSISIFNSKLNLWTYLLGTKLGKIRQIKRISEYNYLLAYDNGINIYKFEDNLIVPIQSQLFNGIKNVFVDSKSFIYVLTRSGTIKFHTKHLNSSRLDNKVEKLLVGIRCTDAVEISDSIYIATNQGIYIIHANNNSRVPYVAGFINSLYLSHKNELFVCTDNDGIFIIKDGFLFDSLNTTKGMPSNSVTCVNKLTNDILFIGTDNGCFIYDQHKREGYTFNKLDCLPSNEIFDQLLLNNSIYIATYNGVFVISEGSIKPNFEIPFFKITESYAINKGNKYSIGDPLEYYQNHIRVNFITRSLLSSNNLVIKYQLNAGFDSWIYTKNNFIDFVDLNYNKYQLKAKIINEDNVETDLGTILNFEIMAPWWISIWMNSFYVLIFILLGLLLATGVFYLYKYQLLKKLKMIDKFNELKLEALQNQMNPHFIFNSLNAIQGFLGFNDESKSLKFMSRFGKLMRMIIDQSKQKMINLEQEIELISSYIKLEQMRFGTNLEVEFKIDPLLMEDLQYIKIPPLLVQPIVENSFRHGLMHLSTIGRIIVEYKFEDDNIICIVEDNGIGRSESKRINQWGRKNHVSTGISSAAERVSIIDKSRGILKLDIVDLYNPDSSPAGTRTTIYLQRFKKDEFKV